MQQADFNQQLESLRQQLLRQARQSLAGTDEAEDVVQESMLKLWILRERFDTSEDMTRYAQSIIRNMCINIHKRRQTLADIEEVSPTLVAPSPLTLMITKELEDIHSKIVQSLPDKHRAVLHLRNEKGLSYKDIATIMGCEETTVRVIAARARKYIITLLSKYLNGQI